MGLDHRNYDEKRDFVRVTVDYELGLQAADDGRSFTAMGKNLSTGGVLFHTNEPLKLGDRLRMHVEARQALLSVLDATIEVVRVEDTGDGRTWAVGGAITQMHDS
ncbi:hypothetical protein MNBD_GAMMA13-577 [hydrothermal vent metagenome]|uniref:PilZ domain-containing protein n=1 Tax=hydrothermal vent metagenome TaxID=652676 RepID=A0A3B0Z980_9ZZZZ